VILTKQRHAALRAHRGATAVVDDVAHNPVGATLLAPYQGAGSIGRADEWSHWRIHQDRA
jgi:hypothetical protein